MRSFMKPTEHILIRLVRLSFILWLLPALLQLSTALGAVTETTPCSGRCFKISGAITTHDLSELKHIAQDVSKGPRSTPLFSLDSAGGDVVAAMEIGRLLRKIRAVVAIGTSAKCYSACVFILAGATQRVVYGKVGIHRPYSIDTKVRDYSESQKEYHSLQRIAKSFLSEMNLPDQLYEAMVRTPSEKIRVLSDSELEAYGLNQTDPVEEELQDSYDARRYGLSKQEFLKRKALAEEICWSSQQNLSDHARAERWLECREDMMRRR